MDDELSTVVALLHDVIEDTPYSFDDLERLGFGNDVIEALRLLTHDADVPYLDYVKKIAANPTARKVKLADLAHNSDITRLDHDPTEKDLKRLEKYWEARNILLESSPGSSGSTLMNRLFHR
jgi:(p)ppGpp synthase/HD superfamily hydrolase